MFTLEPSVQALIFDCDGTLADTMPHHFLAWRDTIRGYGGDFPEELFYQTGGMPSEAIVKLLNSKFGYTLDPVQIAEEKESLFADKYLLQVEPIEPVIAIARWYQGKLPMAVATGGIRQIVQPVLDIIGVHNLFDTVVTSEDVAAGKPAPDTFLETARRLNTAPTACHVFEDSELGFEAAEQAGMSYTDVRPWYQ